MNSKTSRLIIVLAMVAAFLTGSSVAKKKFDTAGKKATPTAVPTPSAPVFQPVKSAKPEVKFFVMSFCPYGNQAEAGLEPVYQLLKDKVSWVPRYIISDKKVSCEQGCPYKVYSETQCQELLDSKRVPDMETCKKYFPYSSADECLNKECVAIKPGEYESLHGQQELNQDIREIIVYNTLVETGSKVLGAQSEGILAKWWKFIGLVNQNCNSGNADTCWQAQAKTAGINTADILNKEKSQLKTLSDKETAEAQKYKASGSPTVFINGVLYSGGRSAEDYKKAICSSFENPPEECSQVLGQETTATSEGCGQ